MVGTKVYIGGLPYGVRERDLEKFVKGYGRVRDVLLKNGFGFVVSIFLEMIFLHVLSPKSSHPFPVSSLLGILLSKLSSFFFSLFTLQRNINLTHFDAITFKGVVENLYTLHRHKK